MIVESQLLACFRKIQREVQREFERGGRGEEKPHSPVSTDSAVGEVARLERGRSMQQFRGQSPDPLIPFLGAGISSPSLHPDKFPSSLPHLSSICPTLSLVLARICWMGDESGRNA
ncbi:hypothetical protein ACUV84_040803 [Puccinellia chinampoensis]